MFKGKDFMIMVTNSETLHNLKKKKNKGTHNLNEIKHTHN